MSNLKCARRGFRNFKQNKSINNCKKNEVDSVTENNPILMSFKNYSKELDNKHDRYERILKLGRDITIESKRIIFLLHTIDSKKDNNKAVLEEAKKRLKILYEVNFLGVAKELGDLDPYQYGRAYSPGLQEFIEAYTFYEYLSNKKELSDWNKLQDKLNYEIEVEQIQNKKSVENNDINVNEKEVNDTANNLKKIKLSCFIQPIEYISGLADVGEVMRRCINSLGSGDLSTCFESCKSLQELYAGYLSITSARCRDLSRKIYTLKQSVLKVENVCYNVKVRGGEAAKWGSITDISEKHYDEDEGYF